MRLTTLSLVLSLGPVCMTAPALGQSTSNSTACANEAQRLSDGFSLGNANANTGTTSLNTLSAQPGTRVGASMSPGQQQQARSLTQQAQTAAGRGNTTGCLQNLNQARSLLRNSGIGPAPRGTGGATPDTTATGSSDSTTTASDRLRAAATRAQNTDATNVTPPTRNSSRARALNGSGSGRGGGGGDGTSGGSGGGSSNNTGASSSNGGSSSSGASSSSGGGGRGGMSGGSSSPGGSRGGGVSTSSGATSSSGGGSSGGGR